MVARRYVPERGDLVWVDFDPTRGHEQAKARPALVLSPKTYNRKTGLMLASPITSQVKGYPFEVRIGSKKVAGVVLADQIRVLDWQARGVQFAGRVTDAVVKEVVSKVKLLIEY